MKTALTIGFFDGVHLGHQALLRKLREHPHTTILTFPNHPQSILYPPAPECLIPLKIKLTLLKEYADEIVVLPFTKELAATPYEKLLDRFDLNHLILGVGSVFGKNRQGDQKNVKRYAKQKKITVEYFPKIFFADEPISSSRIRKAMNENNQNLVQQLLGRRK